MLYKDLQKGLPRRERATDVKHKKASGERVIDANKKTCGRQPMTTRAKEEDILTNEQIHKEIKKS
jgi:hypothetical protein